MTGNKVVFNTRASFAIVKGAVNVLLTAEADIAAKRLYDRYKTETVEIKKNKINKKVKSETHRFYRQLDVEFLNPLYYDLVLDTSLLSAKEVKDLVLSKSTTMWFQKSMCELETNRRNFI